MHLRQITPASAPVYDLEAAKAHLRVDHDDDNLEIAGLVEAVTLHLAGPKGILGRTLVATKWALDLDAFPGCGRFSLPLPPIQAIDTVKYVDAAGVTQLVDPATYDAFVGDDGFIELARGKSWATPGRRSRGVSIEFTAGYGEPKDVPAPIIAAHKLLLADLYKNRDGQQIRAGAVTVVKNSTVDNLLTPYRLWSL